MDKKYILLSLEDERIKAVAGILGNKTTKKIIDFLADKKEASENDIAQGLKLPLNTIEYNLKKMMKAGLIEEAKNFFWSKKGRKIKMYKFSNKSIIISPKLKPKRLSNEIKQILPIAFIAGFVGMGIKYYLDSNIIQTAQEKTLLFATGVANATEEPANIINIGEYWIWFLGGMIFIIVMFIIKMILFEKMWEAKK